MHRGAGWRDSPDAAVVRARAVPSPRPPTARGPPLACSRRLPHGARRFGFIPGLAATTFTFMYAGKEIESIYKIIAKVESLAMELLPGGLERIVLLPMLGLEGVEFREPAVASRVVGWHDFLHAADGAGGAPPAEAFARHRFSHPQFVHRLDKGTGGLLVYARTQAACARLATAFATPVLSVYPPSITPCTAAVASALTASWSTRVLRDSTSSLATANALPPAAADIHGVTSPLIRACSSPTRGPIKVAAPMKADDAETTLLIGRWPAS